MQAEIITIGDEILIGQIIDTNSAFLGKQLNKIGVSVYQITSVQDNKSQILKALKEAESNADIIIITGGLGPTKDDITKHTLCEYFEDELIQNQKVLDNIEMLFSKYISTPISDINRQQAMVPSKCKVLMNKYGTAPGMWFEKVEKVFVSLPGVPYEMKALVNDDVLPRLRETYKFPFILHKTLLTYGLGESAISNRIEVFEDNLPDFIKLAYLPNLGKVRLRLSAKNMDRTLVEQEMERQVQLLIPQIEDIFVGFEETESIETIIAKQFKERSQTLALAESFTGGKISEIITKHAGASQFYKGGINCYATESKIEILGVSEAIISKFGVVSKEVAAEMAIAAKKLFKSDYAIATTGNAGPEKGDEKADVGEACIAIATPKALIVETFNFGNHREKVIDKGVNKSFEMLLKEILKN
ncbi:CinA family nicotinamide mononucleotide deamidase-related protein [Paucihalobacter sp.]|uniref:CinA family nicotinamide mononucleotide deamidase-related protein n=1 Tax=Paucihalobacter sp. TaxID=2850405 RepID=UPI002FE4220E